MKQRVHFLEVCLCQLAFADEPDDIIMLGQRFLEHWSSPFHLRCRDRRDRRSDERDPRAQIRDWNG